MQSQSWLHQDPAGGLGENQGSENHYEWEEYFVCRLACGGAKRMEDGSLFQVLSSGNNFKGRFVAGGLEVLEGNKI